MTQKTSLIFCLFLSAQMYSQEYILFDVDKKPFAYLIASESDLLIYEFEGEGLAKLEEYDDESYTVFGKNGLHLGWYADGWLYDQDGYVVGFLEGALKTRKIKIPEIKERKSFTINGYKEPSRIQSTLQHVWSQMTLKFYFRRGLTKSPYPNNYFYENKDERKIHKI